MCTLVVMSHLVRLLVAADDIGLVRGSYMYIAAYILVCFDFRCWPVLPPTLL